MYCTRRLKDATSVMSQPFSHYRFHRWIWQRLIKMGEDIDKLRVRASAGRLLYYAGRHAYASIHSIKMVTMPRNGVDGISTQDVTSQARLPWQPRAIDDGSHRGMDDLRVRPFSPRAGRKSHECAQYAIGASLLARNLSAQVSTSIGDLQEVSEPDYRPCVKRWSRA